MPDLTLQTLPLLPLTSGVVLPSMVVTATLETAESRAAASAARDAGQLLVLVPKVGERYARVGTVAEIQEAGELRGVEDPGHLADTAVYSPDLPFDRKVELLETIDVTERL